MKTKGHIGSRRGGYLFLILPLLIYGAFFILPNVSSLVYSLFSWNGISEERTFVGLAKFADRIFRTALINTVKYTVTLVLFQTLIGFLLALLVQKTNRINSAFRTIYFLPAIIAASTVGLIWGFIYDPNIGALNELLRILGLSSWRHAWLSDEKIVIYAIAAVHIWVGIGQSVVLFVAGLQNIPQDVLELLTERGILTQFDGGVASCEVQVNKPDPQIYKALLKKYQLKASECIFIDDRLENVQAAFALGFAGIQMKDSVGTLIRSLATCNVALR
mgnify:CR=1 FL=1